MNLLLGSGAVNLNDKTKQNKNRLLCVTGDSKVCGISAWMLMLIVYQPLR